MNMRDGPRAIQVGQLNHLVPRKLHLSSGAKPSCGASDWSPFANKDEWETGQWLLKNVGLLLCKGSRFLADPAVP